MQSNDQEYQNSDTLKEALPQADTLVESLDSSISNQSGAEVNLKLGSTTKPEDLEDDTNKQSDHLKSIKSYLYCQQRLNYTFGFLDTFVTIAMVLIHFTLRAFFICSLITSWHFFIAAQCEDILKEEISSTQIYEKYSKVIALAHCLTVSVLVAMIGTISYLIIELFDPKLKNGTNFLPQVTTWGLIIYCLVFVSLPYASLLIRKKKVVKSLDYFRVKFSSVQEY